MPMASAAGWIDIDMDDKRKLAAMQRLETAAAAHESVLEVQRQREAALIDRLSEMERDLLERRSETIAGLSLELSLVGARLSRLVTERENALDRQAGLQESWARVKRIGALVGQRRTLLAERLDRAEQERRLQDWVAAMHLQNGASSRTDS